MIIKKPFIILKNEVRNWKEGKTALLCLQRGLNSGPCIWIDLVSIVLSQVVLKWVWFSAEHPVIANSFTLCTWGYVEGSSLVTMSVSKMHLSCGSAAGAQRPEVISTPRRGLEKRTWKRECLPWTLKNWLDFSWWGMWVRTLRWGNTDEADKLSGCAGAHSAWRENHGRPGWD